MIVSLYTEKCKKKPVKNMLNFRNFRLLFYFSLLIVVFFAVFLTASCTIQNQNNLVCFHDNCFFVEIARTEHERSLGLMFRDSLPENQGMLFIFEEEDYHAFWMKNTNIPLDIIWLDSELTVVHISRSTPPCLTDPCPVYTAPLKAKYVLEVNAGAAEKLNPGEKVEIYLN
ncbi:MAG: DUF192 domain-containing protein [Candidatus Woesearchaeota archaeon]